MKSTYQLLLLDLFFSHCVSLPAEKKRGILSCRARPRANALPSTHLPLTQRLVSWQNVRELKTGIRKAFKRSGRTRLSEEGVQL